MAGLFGLCTICGGDDLHPGGDGFFYCTVCGSQSQQYQELALDNLEDQQFAGYQRVSQQRAPAAEAPTTGDVDGAFLHSGLQQNLEVPLFDTADGDRPWETELWSQPSHIAQKNAALKPMDPSETIDDDGYSLRRLYIEGLQETLQIQCETLVVLYGVSPLVCGIVGPVWLRFLASTHVFEKEWAKEAIQVEDARAERRRKKQHPHHQKKQLQESIEGSTSQDVDDGRVQMRTALRFVLLRALKERIPISITLALVYLGCHVARQPILPTDIVDWALDGSLPYLAAFHEIEKKRAGLSWPIKARLMFKPKNVIGARKLEHMAASIARRTGLQLPPVNFHAIACRLLKQLNLPIEKLSEHVCRFFDWYTPSGLWLSDEAHALPSRVYVMAIIVVVLKVLYRVDGRWCCEKYVEPTSKENCHESGGVATHETDENCSLSNSKRNYTFANLEKEQSTRESYHDSSKAEQVQDETWSLELLLEVLEKPWLDRRAPSFDKEKDLVPYLRYCQDVVFSGLELEGEEKNLCERLWRLYEQPAQKLVQETTIPKKESFPAQSRHVPTSSTLSGGSHFSLNEKEPTAQGISDVSSSPMTSTDEAQNVFSSNEGKDEHASIARRKFRSLKEIKDAIAELGFTYLPPRGLTIPSGKYMRYVRKQARHGAITNHGLHADYFILLCSCAKVISVKPAALYWGVQRVEKCLIRIERKVKDLVITEIEKLTKEYCD